MRQTMINAPTVTTVTMNMVTAWFVLLLMRSLSWNTMVADRTQGSMVW